MDPSPLHGLRVALFAFPASGGHVARALASRGAAVDRVVTGAGAVDALLQGRHPVLVTDRILPGVVLVMQARHLLTGSFAPPAFGDQFVECLATPVDPAVLAAAVARAARRVATISSTPDGGAEAAA